MSRIKRWRKEGSYWIDNSVHPMNCLSCKHYIELYHSGRMKTFRFCGHPVLKCSGSMHIGGPSQCDDRPMYRLLTLKYCQKYWNCWEPKKSK